MDRTVLADLVARDLSVREIARETGRSYTTVRYWLGRHELATTPAARRGRRPAATTTAVCPAHGETIFVRKAGVMRCGRCRAAAVSEWRRRTKRRLVEEHGGRCALCGYDRTIAALQFHHLDPATKSFGIAGRGLARSIETLRAEAAKCVLLCANCHVEVEVGHATIPSAGPDRG